MIKKSTLLKLVNTEINFPKDLFNISTDTRKIKKDDLFIALDGENFQGINFCKQALEKGAIGFVYNANPENDMLAKKIISKFPKKRIIPTNCTLSFLQKLANLHRRDWGKFIIGITGSNGKTTTKEMLHHLLQSHYKDKIIATKGNLNNFIGVPLSLLEIDTHHDIAIIEMGTSLKGEIKLLCDIAEPSAGIITNIGKAHIEFLESEEGIFDEKRALYDSLDENSLFVINKDDKFLSKLELKENMVSFSFKDGADYKLSKIPQGFKVNDWIIENSHILGIHNQINLAAALILSYKVAPASIDLFIQSAKDFIPRENRSSWIEYNGARVFLDAYNANPSSMEASLRAFAESSDISKALFVLGDMNELGPSTAHEHENIASLISNLGGENAYFIGQYSQFYEKGFKGRSQSFANVEELANSLGASWIKESKLVFIKGSRSLQLESLIDIS